MKFRIANNNDLSQIVEIFNQAIIAGGANAFTELVTVEDRKNWFDSHREANFVLVCEIEEQEHSKNKLDKIIAWCSISPYRQGRMALSKTAEISYYVHKDHQGKSVGKTIVKEAIKLAKSKGIKNLIAIMLDTNTASKNLLLKLDFQIWGQLPNIAEFPNYICGQYYIGKNLTI